MNLSTSIEEIPRVGLQYQKKLKKLGIKTVRDLLFHFPHRYEDFSNIVSISQVKIGQTSSIQGKILKIENTRTWKKRMFLTQAIVEDKSGAIKVVWFNQPYLINVLKEGDYVCLAGKANLGGAKNKPELYLSNPAYEKLSRSDLDRNDLTHTGRLVPIYPETEGLSSRWLRFILKPLLFEFREKIPEVLPEKIINFSKLLPFKKALWQIHFPDSLSLAKKAKERFSFEELFFISLLVQRERQKLSKEKAIPIPLNLSLLKNFVSSLPFELTSSQKKSAWQILKDLTKERPMNRLLEGDVGSGKTVVAAMAALSVAKLGFQVALMAPTEILAKQHFKTISELLKKFNLKIGLLTGKGAKLLLERKGRKISRKKLLEKIKEDKISILIGTHALIQEEVKFGKLALVIVDEQHRFGVEQRAKLVKPVKPDVLKPDVKRSTSGFTGFRPQIPHLLSMTATPIPRTLALTIYGDLDLSLITEMPKGRKKIITRIIPPELRKTAYDFIRKEVRAGKQVFVICPRIEPSTTFQENNFSQTENTKSGGGLSWAEVKAVKEEYEKLSKIVFPDLRVAMLHGRMKTEEKEKIMRALKKRKIDILVSTSVVEVGIDIPSATIMMIEGAERFGLAQLHQFRGRVGRGKHQSFCFLFTDSPAKKTSLRLKALLDCENGFELAEKDLEIRGPGVIDGKRQWGIPDITMDSLKDIFLVEKTRRFAKEILEEDPELKKYPLLREKLEEFKTRVHLE